MASRQQPDILLLFPDQWRWDWLGCEASPHGRVPVRTPHIDALAARGVRFTQCRSNSPVCGPARACLAQGVRYERCGVPTNSFDMAAEADTVFRRLRDAGYRTLTCGKNDLHKHEGWKGRDGWTQRLGQFGFTDAIEQSGKLDAARQGAVAAGGPNCAYTSYLHSRGLFDVYANDYRRRHEEMSHTTAAWASDLERPDHTDDFCGRMALKLLQRTPSEGPWMLWVNWPGPHDPFDPPEELRRRYDGVTFPMPVAPQATDARGRPIDHQQIRRNYAAACEGIDEWVGWILDAVRQRGELDDTVVVFASDHGELLGDHGMWTKSNALEGSVHVPLIVAGPGVPEGVVCDDLVELIDISAQMLAWAQLEIPRGWDAQPFLGDPPRRSVQLSSLGRFRMAFDGRYKLVVRDSSGRHADRPMPLEENPILYDLAVDPGETRNVATDHADVVARLHAALPQPNQPRA